MNKKASKSVRQQFTTSNEMNKRLLLAVQKKGLKDTDILRIALSEYLDKNNIFPPTNVKA